MPLYTSPYYTSNVCVPIVVSNPGIITGTTGGTSTDAHWVSWNTTVNDTSISTVGTQVWRHWNEPLFQNAPAPYGGPFRVVQQEPTYYQPSVETAAELQSHIERQVAIEGERAQARERAEKLLRENLSPKQLEELSQKNYFTLETVQPDGSRRTYRIGRGRARNIKEFANGTYIRTLCAHPIEAVPDADTMLAQKLWLETMEEDFRKIANFS